MKTSISILVGALALTSVAAAQQPSIYIDLEGLSYGTAGPAPATLAAAAPAAGMWNVVDGDVITALPASVPPLMDTAGNMTAVALEIDSTSGFAPLTFSQDNVATTGDDDALLDDCIYNIGPLSFTFTGLPAGNYDVYTYCVAPDFDTAPTDRNTTVDVVGSTGVQTVTGDFSTGYSLGLSHALHTVTVTAGGTLVINTDLLAATDLDSVNGIQILPAGGAPTIGSPFCMPNNNSTGVPSLISATGSDVAADNNVTLHVDQVPPLQFGIFVVSATAGGMTPVNQGILCLTGQTGRFTQSGQIWQADATGSASLMIDLTMIPTPTAFVPTNAGDTWFFQAWHRDVPPMPGQPGSNFTDGVEINFQ